MKLNYRLSKVCGSVYSNGRIVFTSDGNSILSCIGNRISIFDLIHHTTTTLPFENNFSIHRLAVSNNGVFLITIDKTGHALIINIKRQILLLKFNFKRKVNAIQFSSDDKYFAITSGNGVQIWSTPSVAVEFAPLSLVRTMTGFGDETISLDWSLDDSTLMIGSKDLTARIYFRPLSTKMSCTYLTGHREAVIMGVYLANDLVTAYSIAKDGAVFTWIFETHPRTESFSFY